MTSGTEFMHIGVGHLDGGHSGRYPWGSGDDPYQRGAKDWLSQLDAYKKLGLSQSEIAKTMGILNKDGDPSSTRLRAYEAIANHQVRSALAARALQLREEGRSLRAIGKELGGLNESSIRSLLDEQTAARKNVAMSTAEFLKKMADEHSLVDVGLGQETVLSQMLDNKISRERMTEALAILEAEGYNVYNGRVPNATDPNKQTVLKVLAKPGVEHREIYDYENIYYPFAPEGDFVTQDGGDTFHPKFVYPQSIDGKRVQIRYAEQGGEAKDGLVEIRPGVEDLNLGPGKNYAQVRILVDGTHYIKGMAVYNDELPDGTDIIFNTNKKEGTPMCGPKDNTVLKNIKNDPLDPFNALLKDEGGQTWYVGKDGKEHLSAINKCREEGDWDEWSRNTPSQFLAKQSKQLVDQQLKLAIAKREDEFSDIMSCTNPTVKKFLLNEFADACDTDAVKLKGAAFPRQRYQVILPLTTLKDNECFAPNYDNGEKVALIRYPHAGQFEIEVLTVNNHNKEGLKLIGNNALDAVGIKKKSADKLSGADFDGDTVQVIPITSKSNIQSKDPLPGLVGFDPKLQYGGKEPGTFKPMKDTQKQMGAITNLISDMTIAGAEDSEIAAAVRHSMVVIDAAKHGLDYTQSAKDNKIRDLKVKYQGVYNPETGRTNTPASSILTRAKSEYSVPKRSGYKIDPETGKKVYREVEEYYTDSKGNKVRRMQKSTQMAETDDATTLLSKFKTPIEQSYANYANAMKSLGNRARKAEVDTPNLAYSPENNKKYKDTVDSLEAGYRLCQLNKPLERKAQGITASQVKALTRAHPELKTTPEGKKELKKKKQKILSNARQTVGAKRNKIELTDKYVEAINKGAVSSSALSKMLLFMDEKEVRNKFIPKPSSNELSAAKKSSIRAYANAGYTNAEIAKQLGVSESTVIKYLK